MNACEHLPEGEHLGLVVDQREVDDPEGHLHLGVGEQLVEYDLFHGVRRSSMTMRMPSRSLSSRRSVMPSILLSLTSSAMFSIRLTC